MWSTKNDCGAGITFINVLTWILNFDYQITYPTTEVLMPGETITTTCTFSAPNCAGQSTAQEMCYLFTYAYPKLALTDSGLEGTFMHGDGVCLGQ